MFDLARTVELIKGMIVEPRPTWERYYPESGDPQRTLGLLTIPLIVGAAILTWLLSHLFGSFYLFGGGFGLGFMLSMIVFWAIGFGVFVLIISYLAKVFKGEGDWRRGLAAMSLATVPSWIGSVLSTLPLIGFLIGLALSIYALVLIYKIIPLYLKVPESSRVGHFIATLVCALIAGFILGSVLGFGMMGQGPMMEPGIGQPGAPQGGLLPYERKADLMAEAEADRYDPPADGRVTEAQLAAYLDVLRKTADLRSAYGEDMDRLAQSIESKDGAEPSMKDLGTVFSGVMKLGGMAMAEMEVVKTGGGNWAEHSWVKEQLWTARIHKDSPETAHNWALYQQHAAELQALETGP
jgi:hypothetical protein